MTEAEVRGGIHPAAWRTAPFVENGDVGQQPEREQQGEGGMNDQLQKHEPYHLPPGD
jgi:hypothetical protein